MLRWKLKKSVPFEADETVFPICARRRAKTASTSLPASRACALFANTKALAEQAGLYPWRGLSSSLAAITLLDDHQPTLLARISGLALTTAIVREGVSMRLSLHRTSRAKRRPDPANVAGRNLSVAAYYQDTWREGIQSVRVAGLGARLPEFVGPLENEFKCEVRSLLQTALSEGRVPEAAQAMADHENRWPGRLDAASQLTCSGAFLPRD